MTTAEALLKGLRQGPVDRLPAGIFPLHLLIVETDAVLLGPLTDIGQQLGFTVHRGTPAEVAAQLDSLQCDVVLLDLTAEPGGLVLLRQLRQSFPRVPILVTTAFASVQTAVEALRVGATDFLTKPFSLEELTSTLQTAAERRSFDMELRRVQHQMRTSPEFQEPVATSPAMQKLMGMVARVGASNHPVVVVGESGTGKERIARVLHAASIAAHPKAAAGSELRFHHVLCGGMGAEPLEEMLFGSAAAEGKPEKTGLLTHEGGGTLFLDEVDALSLDLQAKLLRALQQKSVRLPGVELQRPVTVRFVASSSRDLSSLVDRGAFRKDLYFRLNVVNLRVPSLRQRREDIPLLAATFLQRCGEERNLSFTLGPDAMRALLEYDWPGNVRELEAVIARACSVSSGPVLHVIDLPSQLQPSVGVDVPQRIEVRAAAVEVSSAANLPIEPIAEMEKKAILAALEKLNGDKLMTAKLLGIGKTTLYRKLKEYGLADL